METSFIHFFIIIIFLNQNFVIGFRIGFLWANVNDVPYLNSISLVSFTIYSAKPFSAKCFFRFYCSDIVQ